MFYLTQTNAYLIWISISTRGSKEKEMIKTPDLYDVKVFKIRAKDMGKTLLTLGPSCYWNLWLHSVYLAKNVAGDPD